VSRSIDNHQPWNVNFEFHETITLMHLFVEFLLREKGGTDLLSDTSCFAFLDVGFSDFIQKSCLACVYVTEDSADGAPELALLSLEEDTVISQDAAFFFFL
jgi:hypothetical protein